MRNYQTTTLVLSDLDRKMIAELSQAIGEKTIVAVVRFALRETYKNFFGKLTENHENQTVCDSIDFRDGARLPALAMAAGSAEVRANQD